MQVNQPVSGCAEAITVGASAVVACNRLDVHSLCDVCGKPRFIGRHARCSRIRQQSNRSEWDSYLANLAAKKALGGPRYGR